MGPVLENTTDNNSLDSHRTSEETLLNMVKEQDAELGKSTTERYQGPQEASITATRGVIWGAVGAGLGFALGIASDANPSLDPHTYKGYNKRFFTVVGAIAGSFLGMFSGSREVREGKHQLWRMQRRIEHLEEHNEALKQEIKAQLRGEGVLKHFDPEWEKGGKETDKKSAEVSNDNTPATTLDAQSIAAHTLQQEREPHRPNEPSLG